ncbi:MAG: hypothetical protein ACJ8GK_05100 [Luteimonas sp.]
MQRMPSFHRYRDHSGHSGVVAYALLPDGLAVQFIDGMVYLYTHDCPGRRHVARMKALARDGQGLSTYISRHIGNRFSARLERGALQTFPSRDQSSTRQNTAFR